MAVISPVKDLVPPLMPVFYLDLMGNILDFVPPQFNDSLTVTSRAEGAWSYSITLVDEDWDRLEPILIELLKYSGSNNSGQDPNDGGFPTFPVPTGGGDVGGIPSGNGVPSEAKIRYGWVDAENTRLLSRWHRIIITDFAERIENDALVLEINAIDALSGKSTSKSENKAFQKPIPNILDDIVTEYDFFAVSSDIDEVEEPGISGSLETKKYQCNSRSTLGFFRDFPLVDASYKGRSGNIFMFILPYTTEESVDEFECDGEVFDTVSGSTATGSVAVLVNPADEKLSPLLRAYEYRAKQKPNDGLVRAWQPELNGYLLLSFGSGIVESRGFSLATKNPEVTAVGNEAQEQFTHGQKGENRAGEIIKSPNQSKSAMESEQVNRNFAERSIASAATLEILGDPCIRPFSKYELLVHKPNGELHHSSGVYVIRELTHTITAGDFNTSLVSFKYSQPVIKSAPE